MCVRNAHKESCVKLQFYSEEMFGWPVFKFEVKRKCEVCFKLDSSGRLVPFLFFMANELTMQFHCTLL